MKTRRQWLFPKQVTRYTEWLTSSQLKVLTYKYVTRYKINYKGINHPHGDRMRSTVVERRFTHEDEAGVYRYRLVCARSAARYLKENVEATVDQCLCVDKETIALLKINKEYVGVFTLTHIFSAL